MTLSKLAAISTVQLIWSVALASGQERVNPQAQAMAHFSERVTAYLALQKKEESGLATQKETNDPERIKAHIKALADRIRAARTGAKPGDVFNGASDQFRLIIQQDGKNRTSRDATATMKEVPKAQRPQVNADYPETGALATVPPLILKRLQRLPDGLEYRFMGRDLILRDTKANLIVDVLPEATPTTGR